MKKINQIKEELNRLEANFGTGSDEKIKEIEAKLTSIVKSDEFNEIFSSKKVGSYLAQITSISKENFREITSQILGDYENEKSIQENKNYRVNLLNLNIYNPDHPRLPPK